MFILESQNKDSAQSNINGIENFSKIQYFVSNCFTKLACNSKIVIYQAVEKQLQEH